MPISCRMTDAEELDEVDEDVEPEAVLSRGVASFVVGCGKRSGEASRSAFWRSRSTMSMIKVVKGVDCRPVESVIGRCGSGDLIREIHRQRSGRMMWREGSRMEDQCFQ